MTTAASAPVLDKGLANTIAAESQMSFIDGANGKADNSDSEADATVKVDWDDFQKLVAGQLDPTMAFMQGKLKVLGDMSVAMQLQSLMKKFS